MLRPALMILIAAGVILPGNSGAQTRGDWVLARKGGLYWYPGIVRSISGDIVTVTYDDGEIAGVGVEHVRPYTWAIGDRVECDFKGAGRWYPGVIASLAGGSIGINYDDGDRERTRTGRCRSK